MAAPARDITKHHKAKKIRTYSFTVKRFMSDFLLISLGVLSAGFGLKGFLLPSHFIDGGATGISLLISLVNDFSLPVVLVLINIPFFVLAYTVIGRGFAIKTSLAIGALAIIVSLVPYPVVTHDKLLVAVFGGFFLGGGIGLVMRGGAVIDGTEVLAIFLNRRSTLSIGDVILLVNIIIFSIAAYFLSIETAMYAMLTYLAASKTVDFVIEGIEEYTGVTIISIKSEMIKKMIIEKMGHGVTIYKGKRGFGKSGVKNTELDIVYTVITRLEVNRLNSEIEKIDREAFITMTSIRDTRGGMIKKRAMKE